MGTGKTVAAIELDLRHRMDIPGRLPTLVIAPLTTLKATWEDHFNRLAPHLTTHVINPKSRPDFVRALKNNEADVYILHWQAIRLKDMGILRANVIFGHVIADESHRAKGRKSQQTRALWTIRTKFRTALTGTPVTNKPYDLWAQLKWLYPDEYGSFWRFYESYCEYEIDYAHGNGYRRFIGPKNEADLLKRIRPFYRRHLKKEQCCKHHPDGVQPQLPDKYYQRIWVDLHPKQRRAYDQMRKDMIAWLDQQEETVPLVAPVAIAQLVRLQQFAIAYADIVPSTRGRRSCADTRGQSR
jgi:SNF2 family DNA or RNA helicase